MIFIFPPDFLLVGKDDPDGGQGDLIAREGSINGLVIVLFYNGGIFQ
jgi:hypothetical protein